MFRVMLFLLLALSSSLTAFGAISLVDASGRPIVLDQPARRIVALAPDIVENLYAVGAGERIVGRVSYSDYPSQAESIPLVGDYQRFNAEVILSLQPDLILAWLEGNPEAELRRLESFGFKVARLSTKRIEQIPDNLRLLGRLTGMVPEAERVADRFEARLRGLKPESKGVPTLFYQLWDNPLLTVSDDALIGQAIKFCGAHNPFGGRPEAAPQVSVEAVISAAPDLIVSTDEVGVAWQTRWLNWQMIPAVRRNALYTLSADHIHRATPRFLDGLDALCGAVASARQYAGVKPR
ncbi:cobalamin-binding protein [Marinobacterium zhoushanense]|uniref:Cobalamin-binding protein n=1 Tax=Marinobacterium zhoushanense TaxID=1679163 RepID=A0ABQ1K3R9_9GAMM|nr:cobalamin-binding protein [Marinobacterium zhoushanense]GGB83460.1 cobalamin-binding protein [Marinobacterium zhoushanense]